MKKIVFGFLFLLFAVQVAAQNVAVTIKVTPEAEAAKVSFFISALMPESALPVEMKKENNVYTAE